MSSPYWISLNVNILRAGQSGPYTDTIYHYRILDNSEREFDQSFVLRFCTSFLRPAKSKKDGQLYWDTTYTFEKISERTYDYIVLQPFTD
jgi:hypothetical protein